MIRDSIIFDTLKYFYCWSRNQNPLLRERREYILTLARHLVKPFSKKIKVPDLRLDISCMDYL